MSKHRQAIPIQHRGQTVAVCTATRAFFTADIESMPADHPDRARIMCKAMIAGLILNGRVPGPYVDDEAELAADLILEQRGRDRPRPSPLTTRGSATESLDRSRRSLNVRSVPHRRLGR